MKGIVLILVIVSCYLNTIEGYWNSEKFHRLYRKRQRVVDCKQETPNCQRCLAQLGCTWCGNDGIFECATKQSCSQHAQENTCSRYAPESRRIEPFNRENVAAFLDIPVKKTPSVVDFDAKSCSSRKNCSYCTSSTECAWCETKRKCLPHYNTSTTTMSCTSDLWYKDQCLYSSKIKPCPLRTSGCKECTSDSICFWCKATGNCSYYPHDAFTPDTCPNDSWYYQTCSRIELYVVLAPILCIIGVPILIFIILGIVLWCMRKMGYEGLDDPEEDEEDPDSSPDAKRPFLMNHKPEPSRVDELKKKYNLEDRP